MNPAIPAAIITRIGWIFVKYTIRNVIAQIIMLIIICGVLSPKFAEFIRRNAAEPIRPIITGRSPANTAFTARLSL